MTTLHWQTGLQLHALCMLKIYQGVKEFHMLARITCYCKITVFSPFELGNIIVNHPKVQMKLHFLTSKCP